MDQNQNKAKAVSQAMVMENLGNTVKKMISPIPMGDVEQNFRNEKLVFTVQMIPTPLGITAVSSWNKVGKNQYLNLLKQMSTNEEVQKKPEVTEKIMELIAMMEASTTEEGE